MTVFLVVEVKEFVAMARKIVFWNENVRLQFDQMG